MKLKKISSVQLKIRQKLGAFFFFFSVMPIQKIRTSKRKEQETMKKKKKMQNFGSRKEMKKYLGKIFPKDYEEAAVD